MSADDPLQEAAEAIADGAAVDWTVLANRVTSQTERERLDNLRLVAAIGNLHGDIADTANSVREDPSAKAPTASVSPPDRAVGSWGRYRLIEEVGTGSFGKVYRAWDPNLERQIAVKILHSGSADTRVRERVLREGKQLARLRDPNVVSVLDVEEHDGQFGLCMEFVDGETLDEVLRSRGTLNPREAVLVGQDVCRALAAAHAAGLVHRDVKARNIMRDRTGRIVLMDFGAGREVEELERADAEWNQAGTPLYMAPELLAGHHATYSSDMYSVGVLLYYLVTGKYPVVGRTLKEIRTAHMFGTREPISHRRTDLPPEFVGVVERALAANPEQRYRSAAEMLDDLGAANVPIVVPGTGARALSVVGTVAGTAAATTALGAVISRYFNATMGRADFVSDGVVDWFTWGVRSLVAPSVYFAFALIGLAIGVVLHRVLVNVYPPVRRIEGRLEAWVRGCGLETAEHVSCVVLLLSVVLVTGVCWYFSDLLGALSIYPDVSHASVSQLQRLSPAFWRDHENYRLAFTWVAIACVVMWYIPLRLAAKRHEPVNRLLLAGGAAVTLLALLLLAFPYMMLSRNNDFQVAEWKDARCYILGEKSEQILLFCPALEPRLHRVSQAGQALKRMGTAESPFTLFSPTK